MYSVIRFTEDGEGLLWLEKEMATLFPALLWKRDKGFANRYSHDISKADTWDCQQSEILHLMCQYDVLLRECSNHGLQLEIDIAVDQDDLSGRNCTTIWLSDEIIARLHQRRVAISISLYCIAFDPGVTSNIRVSKQ